MKIEKKLFIPSLAILIGLIALIIFNLEFLQREIGRLYDLCIGGFGWLFLLANICCLIFSLWMIFGRYKNVKLGGEDSKPAFSTLSWAGMMFTTSCGAWLVVYSFLEPVYCMTQDSIDVANPDKLYEIGQMYAHFHWGPNAWCIYVPISMAIGYVLYNRKANSTRMSEGIKSITGDGKGRFIGVIADILSICSAVIAPVVSIGTGMPLLTALVQSIFGIPNQYIHVIQIGILLMWILIFGTSVYLGLEKGIKNLSNINIALAFIFMVVFAFIVGLLKVFAAEISSVGLLLNNYIRLSTYTDPFGGGSFVKGWTFGYWACYFVFMPLMGVFNARISKGRTFKQIAIGQLVLCSLGCWVAMATLGNYTLGLQKSGAVDVAGYLANQDEAGAILAVLAELPFSAIFAVVLLIIAFVFLATTMDSSAFAAAEMTAKQNGANTLAPRWLRVLWATVAAIIAFVLVQVGGAKAVRSLCYIVGLPMAIFSFVIILSVIKMLKKDYSKDKIQ